VPADILQHYGAVPEDIFAMRVTPELRAALAELRLRARRNLAHVVGAKIHEIEKPAFLSLAPLRVGSSIWRSPATIRSARLLYPLGGGNGVSGALPNPSRG
jgi:hypothetical protein